MLHARDPLTLADGADLSSRSIAGKFGFGYSMFKELFSTFKANRPLLRENSLFSRIRNYRTKKSPEEMLVEQRNRDVLFHQRTSRTSDAPIQPVRYGRLDFEKKGKAVTDV